jgi:hypothetical protein
MKNYFRVGLIQKELPGEPKVLHLQQGVKYDGFITWADLPPVGTVFVEDLLKAVEMLPTDPDGYRYPEGKVARALSRAYEGIQNENVYLSTTVLHRDLQRVINDQLNRGPHDV